MKVSELIEMGFDPEMLHVPLSEAVVSKAFKETPCVGRNYRLVAIDRLVQCERPWTSEGNIIWDVLNCFVKVECPYCENMMETGAGTGDGANHCVTYNCAACGALANITVPTDGVYFRPPEKKDDVETDRDSA